MVKERCNFARNQSTDAFICASTFYGLEALKTAVQFGKNFSPFLKSNVKLLEDIEEYQNVVIAKLAPMLYHYSVLACYGELRHCTRTSQARYKGVGLPTTTKSRNEAYVKALNFTPNQILELCVEAFDKSNKWSSAYGGTKWQDIAKHGLRYGKISDLIFCDTAFSLSHNSSPFLNKMETKIFHIDNETVYRSLLDTKFSNTPNATILYIIDHNSKLDRRFSDLIARCSNLNFIYLDDYNKILLHDRKKFELIEKIDSSFQPLHYKQRKMTPKKMSAWCKTLKEQKFYDQLKVGMHVMFANPNEYIYYSPSNENYHSANQEIYHKYHMTFPNGGKNYCLTTLHDKIGFENSFENLTINMIVGQNVQISTTSGDMMTIDYKSLVGLDDNCKTVRFK